MLWSLGGERRALGDSSPIQPGTEPSGAGTASRGRLPRWCNLGKPLLRNKDFGGISRDLMNFRVRFEGPFKNFSLWSIVYQKGNLSLPEKWSSNQVGPKALPQVGTQGRSWLSWSFPATALWIPGFLCVLLHGQLSSVGLSVAAGGRQSGDEVEAAITITVVDALSDVITYSNDV